LRRWGGAHNEELLDPGKPVREPQAVELGGRRGVMSRQERRGDRERHGALAGPDLRDEEGIDPAGEELERRLDSLGLGAEGLSGERRESDPVLLPARIVEGRKLLGEEPGERTVVAGDQVGRVPQRDVVPAHRHRPRRQSVEREVVEPQDGERQTRSLNLDRRHDLALAVLPLGDRDELALEDPLGEKWRMAERIVGLQPMPIEHPRGERQGDVDRLGRHRGLEPRSQELPRGLRDPDRRVLPGPEGLDRGRQVIRGELVAQGVAGLRAGRHDIGVRAALREDRQRAGVPGPLEDLRRDRRHRSRAERPARPAADEEDLVEPREHRLRQPPGTQLEVVLGEKLGRGLERKVRHEVQQVARPGVEVLGEAHQEPMLEPPVLGILVIGRVEIENRRPAVLESRPGEPEGIPVEGEVDGRGKALLER
jgi:hypothetical protein